VLSVRPKNLAGERLAVFFRITARRGVHLKEHAFFIYRRVLGPDPTQGEL
jgi:hypothetical protein